MKIYTADKPKPAKKTNDVSLCKIKVKPHHKSDVRTDPRNPPQNEENNEDVQQYVIASKKRTVVLQFESPLQRKLNTKKGKKSVNKKAQGGEGFHPQGAVRGIKNLPPLQKNQSSQRKGLYMIEKKRSGLGLEGTYIQFPEVDVNDEHGSLGQGSFDNGSLNVPSDMHTEVHNKQSKGVDENNWVQLDNDDNYYKSFLKSIQCRVSVKQIKCVNEQDMECFSDEQNCNISRRKMITNHLNGIDPCRVHERNKRENAKKTEPKDIMVTWSGDRAARNKTSLEDQNIDQTFNSLEDDVFDTESTFGDYNDTNGEEDNNNNNENENGWALVNNLLGEIMNYNACANDNACANELGCGDDNGNTPVFAKNLFELEDEFSEASLDPPTALYAAIGTKNWNVALRRLMEAPEEAAMWVSSGTSDNGTVIEFLPLHLACLTEAPLLLVTLLVQAYPDATEQDAMGKLPLHMACETQVDHRIVFLLLNRYPEALAIQDDEGNTPIEIASLSDTTKERKQIIQVLTRKMENTVVTDPTALYHAIDSQDWNYAIRRLVEMPQESTVWVSFRQKKTEMRFLPLHASCLMAAPLFLVADLLQAYPDAIRKKTTQGQLPLHIACEALVDDRIVELLVEQYPEALHIKDFQGLTPLEVVSNFDPSPERSSIIEILMMEIRNDDEKVVFSPTKLYSLVQEKKWDDAVRRVLEAPDEASTWVGANEKKANVKTLPLHLACALRAPLILIAVLAQCDPNSVKQKTSSGKLPLHVACERRADHRVVSFLVHAWPESFHMKDDKGQTCVQTALLTKPSEQRTKIVEALVAFEAKGEEPLTVPGLRELEANNKLMNEWKASDDNDGIEGRDDNANANIKEEKDGTEGRKKPLLVPKKKMYYTKKRNLFQRRKSKTLWKNDEEMFA
jgi:ankyrin repeat protein